MSILAYSRWGGKNRGGARSARIRTRHRERVRQCGDRPGPSGSHHPAVAKDQGERFVKTLAQSKSMERRQYKRRTVDRPAKMFVPEGGSLPCRIKDVSRGGARLTFGWTGLVADRLRFPRRVHRSSARSADSLERRQRDWGAVYSPQTREAARHWIWSSAALVRRCVHRQHVHGAVGHVEPSLSPSQCRLRSEDDDNGESFTVRSSRFLENGENTVVHLRRA